jgi:hypothetical protein
VRGVIVIFAFISAGCAMLDAQPEQQWTKAGSRNGDMAVQLYVCEQWSRSEENLRDCMTGHGWTQAAAAVD